MSSNLATLVGPEVILPSQMQRRPGWTPEQKLYHACLEDAFVQLKANQPFFRSQIRAYHLYAEAWEWLHDPDTSWIASFRNVCDILRLDAEAVLVEVDKKYDAPPPRMRTSHALASTPKAQERAPLRRKSIGTGKLWQKLGIRPKEKLTVGKTSRRATLARHLGLCLASAPCGISPNPDAFARMKAWIYAESDADRTFLSYCRDLDLDPSALRVAIERLIEQGDR